MGAMMPRIVRLNAIVMPLITTFLLGACAQTQLAVHTVKQMQGKDDGRNRSTAQGPRYKVGKAYNVNGVWYYPSEVDDYVEEGIASWYGADFHDRVTANGDTYDMEALTAAHRTLPMPSAVEVTNLRNGRTLTLRVNDRGPFASDRIIDVSRRAAQLLGFQTEGTARVRVRYLQDASRRLKLAALNSEIGKADQVQVAAAPMTPVRTARLAPISGEAIERAETTQWHGEETQSDVYPIAANARPSSAGARIAPISVGEVLQTGGGGAASSADATIYVQVGAYSYFSNALSMRDRVSHLGYARITQHARNLATLYRVRVGPISNLPDAQSVLNRIVDAGVADAQIVVASQCAAAGC